MRNVKEILNDGFSLADVCSVQKNIASLSLRSAFVSYFRTAEVQYQLLYEKDLFHGLVPEHIDNLYAGSYALDACDSITHFQHFLELFLKDILLEDSPLLVYETKEHNDILYNLIHSNTISETEYEKLKFVEFTDAIKRVRCLLDKFNPKYGFLSNYFGMMEQINLLRNRITHRGAFIIRPDALDELFGGYILPFVKVLEQNIEQYKLTLKSRFNLHSTNINPYDILIQEYNKELSVNKNKILVLKLIGLAAYQNDIPYFAIKNSSDSLDEDTILATFYNHEKQKIAERAYSSAHIGRIEKCPVCGCDSFCLEYDTYEGELGDIPYVYEGSCFHCGFRLKGDLLKPNINGLELPDYSIIDN